MPAKQTVVLIACNACALAAFVLLHWLVLNTPDLPATAAQGDAPDAAERPGHWPEVMPNMLAQAPLFSPSRSRAETPASADTSASAPPPPPRLVGIVAVGGQARLALLESDAAARELVGRGEVFGEWRVISIAADVVLLRRETRSSAGVRPEADLIIPLRPPIAGSGLPPNE